MALVKCPECGKEMSELAESCLNCGSPIFDYFGKQKKLDKLNREFEEKIREVESEEIPDKPPILQSSGAISYIILLLILCTVSIAIKFASSPSYYFITGGKAYPSYYFCIAFSVLSVILFIALVVTTMLTRKRNIKIFIEKEKERKRLRKEQIIRQYGEYKNNLSKYGSWEETEEITLEEIQSNILNTVTKIKNYILFFVVLAIIGLIVGFIIVIGTFN